MKKFFSVMLCAIIPILLCTGCEASNAEIANSLDGNMTRLVYSIGYLDSVTEGEMNELIQNSSYFNNVSTQNNMTSAMNNYTANGFRSNTFNNSINTSYNNANILTNNGNQNILNDNSLTNSNGSICNNGENINTGNATTSTLGGLCATEEIANGNTLGDSTLNDGILSGTSNITENVLGTNTSNTTINNGNDLTNGNCCNGCNGINTNGLLTNNTTNNSIGNDIATLSTEETTDPVTYVDTSLLLTSASDLNEILMLISQKRGIIMLYCTDLRAGNGTLTLDEKNAIGEYITIIKETTNYLNTYSNTLTTYMNNIKTIAYTENSQELVNAKLIRANEILKTRYAKLDTCIDSLDAIIAILQRAVGMDYSANYSNSINTQNIQNETTLSQPISQNSNMTNENMGNQNYSQYTNNATNSILPNTSEINNTTNNQNGLTYSNNCNNCCPNANCNYNNQTMTNCPCLNSTITPNLLPDSNKSVIVNDSAYNSNCCDTQNYAKPINYNSNNMNGIQQINQNNGCCNNLVTPNNLNNQKLTPNTMLSNTTKPDYLTNPPEYGITTLPLENGSRPVFTEQTTTPNIEKATSTPSQNILPRPENIISSIETSASNILDIDPTVEIDENFTDNEENLTLTNEQILDDLQTMNNEETLEKQEKETTTIDNNQLINTNETLLNQETNNDSQTEELNLETKDKPINFLPAPVVPSRKNLSFELNIPRVNDQKTIQFLPFNVNFN